MASAHTVIRLVRSDLYRYREAAGFPDFVAAYLMIPGFRYSVFLRAFGAFARGGPLERTSNSRLQWVMRKAAVAWLRRYEYRFGINIPIETRIGPGLFIGHHGGITVNADAIIGANCNLSQNVTIGKIPRGPHAGEPVIGDRVYVGPGAVIVGQITVGDDAAIGANCVVVRDVPANGVVAGVPGEIVSMAGSSGYVNRLWRDAVGGSS